MSFRVIDPEKIKTVRGHITQAEIVEKAGTVFTVSGLSAWERGIYKPSPENVAALIAALGCNFEDISTPFDEVAVCK